MVPRPNTSPKPSVRSSHDRGKSPGNERRIVDKVIANTRSREKSASTVATYRIVASNRNSASSSSTAKSSDRSMDERINSPSSTSRSSPVRVDSLHRSTSDNNTSEPPPRHTEEAKSNSLRDNPPRDAVSMSLEEPVDINDRSKIRGKSSSRLSAHSPARPVETSLLSVAIENHTPNVYPSEYIRRDPIRESIVPSLAIAPRIDPNTRVPRSSKRRRKANTRNISDHPIIRTPHEGSNSAEESPSPSRSPAYPLAVRDNRSLSRSTYDNPFPRTRHHHNKAIGPN